MIIIFLVLFIGLIILGSWIYDKMEFGGGCLVAGGIVGGAISLIALVVLLITVSDLKTIEPKIEMYQTENTKIENQIADCVKQYQKYENETFTEIASDSAITLVSLYPELKADELVKKQIEIYVKNNEKIKELKEEQISGCVRRWWLYFGG